MTTSVRIAGIIVVTFNPIAHAGAISAPGLKVGDVALSFTSYRVNTANDFAGFYEGVISVDDEIQQTSDAITTDTITAAFVRP